MNLKNVSNKRKERGGAPESAHPAALFLRENGT
jgi:hypothetical protein